jgi:hypothetical protein
MLKHNLRATGPIDPRARREPLDIGRRDRDAAAEAGVQADVLQPGGPGGIGVQGGLDPLPLGRADAREFLRPDRGRLDDQGLAIRVEAVGHGR